MNDIALRQRVETAARWVKRSQPAIRADAQGDDITGRVTLTVASIEEQTQLDNTAGKPAYVDIITGPVSRPAYNIWAGESTNSCTLGFGVRNQFGTKFASTAGHCPASATYQYGGVQFTTYTAVYFGSSDFRAYNVPGGNIATNILYTGSGTRSITGTTGWSTSALEACVQIREGDWLQLREHRHEDQGPQLCAGNPSDLRRGEWLQPGLSESFRLGRLWRTMVLGQQCMGMDERWGGAKFVRSEQRDLHGRRLHGVWHERADVLSYDR